VSERAYYTGWDSINGICRSCGDDGETEEEDPRSDEGYGVEISSSHLEYRGWIRERVFLVSRNSCRNFVERKQLAMTSK
jgi:hypothetical protein